LREAHDTKPGPFDFSATARGGSTLLIRNAGEFNGFLKPNVRLFSEPLRFVAGELVLPSGFTPTIDAHALAAHETAYERFMPTMGGWTARINQVGAMSAADRGKAF